MSWSKTVKFVVLNPDEPESDLIFYESDWARIKSLLGQPLAPDFLEVEYKAEYSRRGKLRYVEVAEISDEKYRDKYNNEEMFLKLSGKASEARRILEKASNIAPDEVKITIDEPKSYYYIARIYVNSDLSVKLADRARYILVDIYKLPNEVSKEIEIFLQRKGFRKGEYGGLITRAKMSKDELKKLAEELKDIIDQHKTAIKRMFEEEIVNARSMLWVDDWDPKEPLEDDIRKKLERRKEEAEEEATEAIVDEAVEAEEVGRRILEEVEGVEVELEAETTAVTKEEEPKRQELVKIYLLKMRLPSKYLVQQVKFERNGRGYREIRDFSDKRVYAVASRLEGIRRTAYEKISNYFFFFDPYGIWIAVSEEAVRKADEISEWLRKELESLKELIELKGEGIADRYVISAIPVYFEPRYAREILEESINMLQSEIETLEEKIREAEENKKKAVLRKLERKLEYKQALLESFKKYLEQLS